MLRIQLESNGKLENSNTFFSPVYSEGLSWHVLETCYPENKITTTQNCGSISLKTRDFLVSHFHLRIRCAGKLFFGKNAWPKGGGRFFKLEMKIQVSRKKYLDSRIFKGPVKICGISKEYGVFTILKMWLIQFLNCENIRIIYNYVVFRLESLTRILCSILQGHKDSHPSFKDVSPRVVCVAPNIFSFIFSWFYISFSIIETYKDLFRTFDYCWVVAGLFLGRELLRVFDRKKSQTVSRSNDW